MTAATENGVRSIAPPQVSVNEAWTRVMTDVGAVGKDQRNSQQGYNFRGIDAVVNAVGPALRRHGVRVVPIKVKTRYRDAQTTTGKPAREVTVKVTWRVTGPAGDSFEAQSIGESMDSGDKGSPKAMSVAYRVMLLQTLCIPTDEPDPDSQSYERDNPREHRRREPSGRNWSAESQALGKFDADTTDDELTKKREVLLALRNEGIGFGEWTAELEAEVTKLGVALRDEQTRRTKAAKAAEKAEADGPAPTNDRARTQRPANRKE